MLFLSANPAVEQGLELSFNPLNIWRKRSMPSRGMLRGYPINNYMLYFMSKLHYNASHAQSICTSKIIF